MECLLPKPCLGVEGWIYLAWDRDQYQALMNMVISLQVLQKMGNL
jgi:hypothetical protein